MYEEPVSQADRLRLHQPLLLTTYRAGVPIVAYSESYLQAGAVVALYSTPPQIVDRP